MTAIRTSQQNAYEGDLTAEMGPNDLTVSVDGVGTLTSPCYLVIEMDDDTQREYIYFDGTFTATTFVATVIGNRYLPGSAAGSNITHPVGTKIRTYVGKQHHDDLHDRIDGMDHGALAGLADDDHPQYSFVDGTRAFTGEVAGVTPTAAASLARKDYVDTQAAAAVPTGTILPYGALAAPSGFLLADGSAVSRATYAVLFGVIATTFGVGDGSTTFNVPDLRGRFPLGLAAAGVGAVLGETGGSLSPTVDLAHSHTVDSHTHTINHGHADTIAYAADGAHVHTMPTHTHSINHDHALATSSGHTVGSELGDAGTSGLISKNDVESAAVGLSHRHADGTYTADAFDVVGNSSYASDAHTHDMVGNAHNHTHTVDLPNLAGTSGATDPGDTNSGGSHTHVKSGSVTSHSGSSGAATPGTDSQLSAVEALPNPAYLALEFIIKV